jgi:hypothetical protein
MKTFTIAALGFALALPLSSQAYIRACVAQPIKLVTCEKTANVQGHKVELKLQLSQANWAQNPETTKKICDQPGIRSDFVLYINDTSSNLGHAGFFSKFGTQMKGEQGENADMDSLLSGKPSVLKVYSFDYGDIVGADDVTLQAAAGVVQARVHLDVRMPAQRDNEALHIDEVLTCTVK